MASTPPIRATRLASAKSDALKMVAGGERGKVALAGGAECIPGGLLLALQGAAVVLPVVVRAGRGVLALGGGAPVIMVRTVRNWSA